MAKNQPPETTEYLKKIWNTAYNGETVIFDFSGQPMAANRLRCLREALYSYRKKINKNKLNPEYTKEWDKLIQCEIVRETTEKMYIHKIPEFIFNRKLFRTLK